MVLDTGWRRFRWAMLMTFPMVCCCNVCTVCRTDDTHDQPIGWQVTISGMTEIWGQCQTSTTPSQTRITTINVPTINGTYFLPLHPTLGICVASTNIATATAIEGFGCPQTQIISQFEVAITVQFTARYSYLLGVFTYGLAVSSDTASGVFGAGGVLTRALTPCSSPSDISFNLTNTLTTQRTVNPGAPLDVRFAWGGTATVTPVF